MLYWCHGQQWKINTFFINDTSCAHIFCFAVFEFFLIFFFENCFSQCFLDSFTRLLYHLCCEAREIPARFWQGTRQKVIESIVARMAVSPESAQRLCDVEMHEVYCTINKLWQRKISNSGEIFKSYSRHLQCEYSDLTV